MGRFPFAKCGNGLRSGQLDVVGRRTRPEGRLMDDLADTVIEWAKSGVSQDEIDDRLDEYDLSSEQHSALWLLGWSYSGPRRQRLLAHDTLRRIRQVEAD